MPTIFKPKKEKPKDTRQWSQNDNRKMRQHYYHLKEWRDLSAWYRQENPLCAECLKNGKVTPATEVHHLKSPFLSYLTEEERIQRLLDVNNIESICHNCHYEIHSALSKVKKLDEKVKKWKEMGFID